MLTETKKPNIWRGIAAYADPQREMAARHYVAALLARVPVQNRVDALNAAVKQFGRETVRAVGGEDAA